MQKTYYAVITHKQGDSDYGVFFPEVDNCFTSGGMVENACDVLELHFADWQWADPKSMPFADLNIELDPADGEVVTIVPVSVPVREHTTRPNTTINPRVVPA